MSKTARQDFTVCGQREGSIGIPDHTLTIGPNADIKAHISARAVVIMGAATGNVKTTEKIEIRSTGSVTGDLDH
jgi:cytoskeletal protein CcmA (bactofilin family)